MEEWIKNFRQQFEASLEVVGDIPKRSRFVVVGMGGSNLASGLLKLLASDLDIWVHRDYDLPEIGSKVLEDSLIVLNSYSGNTEEVIDAFNVASERGFAMVAVSVGGTLLEMAKKHGIPYIQLPDFGLQPRMALGLSVRALALAMGADVPSTISFDPGSLEGGGKEFAKRLAPLAAGLAGKTPVIYASRRNFPLAYAWKATINETAKIPAFCNSFPEVNHNEMSGFDAADATRGLSDKFHFIFLKDGADDARIVKRMELTQSIFQGKGFGIETADLLGDTSVDRIFSSLTLCAWTSYYLAQHYGVSSEDLVLVEEFKKKMAQ